MFKQPSLKIKSSIKGNHSGHALPFLKSFKNK
jgi:hypothetical protein